MNQRKELEHLCCYITRPEIANERLVLNDAGQVVGTKNALSGWHHAYRHVAAGIHAARDWLR
ncbi:Putative transposase [Nitrosomonas eutropha]|nr:Putative transposase [Nitrosomonas eutropha]